MADCKRVPRCRVLDVILNLCRCTVEAGLDTTNDDQEFCNQGLKGELIQVTLSGTDGRDRREYKTQFCHSQNQGESASKYH